MLDVPGRIGHTNEKRPYFAAALLLLALLAALTASRLFSCISVFWGHGLLTPGRAEGQYREYTYTYAGKTYEGIHVFTTKGAQSIIPGVCANRTQLAQINPNGAIVPADKVIARINENMFEPSDPTRFYGLNYEGAGGRLFISQVEFSAPPEESYLYTMTKFWPTFCVLPDGTANIRWFESSHALQEAMDSCQCMIAAAHPLVFGGRCVTNELVYDAEPSHTLLYDPNPDRQNDDDQPETRFKIETVAAGLTETAKRTLLGHRKGSGGVYVMACTDSFITLKAAANLMKKLGCDYAVNLDGNGSTQMYIEAGYGPAGKVTSGAGDKVNTAVCAYLK